MKNTQQSEIKKLWQIKLISANSIVELRAIKQGLPPVTKIFRGRAHSNTAELQQAFEDEAIKLNQLGYNIYVVMNSINESFNGKSAKDEDIKTRDLLLIDIDRATSTKEPSNQVELDAANALSDVISTYLVNFGWGEPIKIMSGNGYHLYYHLDHLPNDIKHKELVEAALKELANKFDNESVKVDSCVFNASRITKVPGTIAYKGTESADRPYRMARVLA